MNLLFSQLCNEDIEILVSIQIFYLGGGWEKIAGGRKSNVTDKTLCFFEGWQNKRESIHLLGMLTFDFSMISLHVTHKYME